MYQDFHVVDRWSGHRLHCVYQALIVAIATRHADAVDIKFLVSGRPVWIALPHPTWVEYNRRTGRVITDPLVLEGMSGIFRQWGCHVITADIDDKALKVASEQDRLPDLIISDYFLSRGRTGIETIEWLRSELSASIPAFLISGDTDPATLLEARSKGYHLLHKPVDPMALRAMFQQAIKRSPAAIVRTLQLAEQPSPDAR